VGGGWCTAVVGCDEDLAECHEVVRVIPREEIVMNLSMNLSLAPIVALIAGLLILVVPRLLNYIVAIYLIITGLLGLFPHLR
jgi:hypothetical protein